MNEKVGMERLIQEGMPDSHMTEYSGQSGNVKSQYKHALGAIDASP